MARRMRATRSGGSGPTAEELGIDPARVVAAGASAGGHLAVLTALAAGDADPEAVRPDALLLWYPVLDTSPSGFGHALFGNASPSFPRCTDWLPRPARSRRLCCSPARPTGDARNDRPRIPIAGPKRGPPLQGHRLSRWRAPPLRLPHRWGSRCVRSRWPQRIGSWIRFSRRPTLLTERFQ